MAATTIPESPRYVRLRFWMASYNITDKALGEKLGGISPQAVNKVLRNDTMPTKHYEECIKLGFPPELLPQPHGMRPKARRRPIFPGLEQIQTIMTQGCAINSKLMKSGN